jgi:hypothetical protein
LAVDARQHSSHFREQVLCASEQEYHAAVQRSSMRAVSAQPPTRIGGIVDCAAGTLTGATACLASSQAASASTATHTKTARIVMSIAHSSQGLGPPPAAAH